jgi:hypothetical protein
MTLFVVLVVQLSIFHAAWSLQNCSIVSTMNVTLTGNAPYLIDLATSGVPVAVMPVALTTTDAPMVMLELFASDTTCGNVSDSTFFVVRNSPSSAKIELRTSISASATGAALVIPYDQSSYAQCIKPIDETFADVFWCRSGCYSSAAGALVLSAFATLRFQQAAMLTALAGAALAQTTTLTDVAFSNTSTSEQRWSSTVDTGRCTAYVRARLFLNRADTIMPCSNAPIANVTSGSQTLGTVMLEPEPCPIEGRPYLVDGDDVPMMSRASHATDDERAARWVSRGLGEHASVASFAAFSLQLMVNGAPLALLTGAANANADEVRHAEQSFALASRFAGREISAEPFPRRAISALQPQSLEELAEAALREGCIAETLSVFAAAREIEEAAVIDAEERAVLVGIVRDEARHSALAWRTVAWASGVARNATLNQRLAQIVADEHARCAQAVRCALFERLIVPLADRLIGANDWQRVISSSDQTIAEQSSRSLTEVTIDALKRSF